jgi:predicted enzyme related to lactoylglutathione lyase
MADLPGAPCWIELATNDAERSREFYTRLFGWTAGEGSPEHGGYFMFFRDSAPVAGGMPVPAEMQLADAWNTYLAVEDARTTASDGQQAGATVSVEPMQVADLGTSVVLNDPTGVRIGGWQADTFAGFPAGGGAGAPVWHELLTPEFEKENRFYRDVFGWDLHRMADTDEFRYATLGVDDAARAGIMDAASFADDPMVGHWRVYFASDDVDATMEAATALGATVNQPATDTPYGRLAALTDPTGARFCLLGRNVASASS